MWSPPITWEDAILDKLCFSKSFLIETYPQHLNETAIGDCELAKILNDSLPVIFIGIYILFFFSISVIFCHFLLFFDLQKLQDSVLW